MIESCKIKYNLEVTICDLKILNSNTSLIETVYKRFLAKFCDDL